VNCYVLIGGRSKRLGRSKAELFLPNIAAAARPAFARVVAVQRPGGRAAPIDTIFDEGGDAPVFGVLAALRHARGRCFILATDYPLLTTPLLRDLRRRFEQSAAPMLVPLAHGVPQMLCAGYAPELLPRIQQRVAEGKLDLRGLLPDAETVAIEGKLLLNVNTPAELAEAERYR
jgi:molybdopterin-guanine dinucleotide biosynthesis protein A